MPRFSALLLSILFVAGLLWAGCAGNDDDDDSANGPGQEDDDDAGDDDDNDAIDDDDNDDLDDDDDTGPPQPYTPCCDVKPGEAWSLQGK